MACPDCGELSFFVPTEQEKEEQALGALVKTCPPAGKSTTWRTGDVPTAGTPTDLDSFRKDEKWQSSMNYPRISRT